VLILAALVAIAAQADPRLTEAQVRQFAEQQSRIWNAGDLKAYFATFAPTARFTDQALAPTTGSSPMASAPWPRPASKAARRWPAARSARP
jgi:hypothetical protein